MKWNGATWSKLDSTGSNSIGYSTAGSVNSLVADKYGNVYAAGNFTDVNILTNSSSYYVAEWNGTSWTALQAAPTGDSLNSFASALALDNSGNIYVSGDFNSAGGYYVREWANASGPTGVTSAATTTGAAAVNVYPNPTNGSFTISAPEGGQVTVYSSLGQAVATQSVPTGNATIFLDNVPTGIYMVILTGQNGTYPAVKLVKN
jgi:hypothetical protein